ncbi:MAG: hypothetical protein K1X72_02190 [Pyrinomonadaceae bacterium]|nr:hypothetical protein [Pyrinomonadaceae bacterium]
MTIKDFGARVESVWEGLRPMTKKMLVGAMQTNINSLKPKFSYDLQSDWELSSLLSVLEEQINTAEIKKDTEKYTEIKHLADTVAKVLENQTESAEVFILLAERALKRKDYKKIDTLTDTLSSRFSVGEICEIIRQTENSAIRALGFETLATFPTQKLVQMIDDPIYEEIVRNAIEQQAFEYENEEAKQVLEQLEFIDEINGE